MSINLTDELLAKTKKGKIASAKQVFLEGDQENLQQIGDKTHQLENAIKDITVSGGASTANAVSYSNETSGMTAVTAQGAIDELASKKANSADVTSQMQTEQTRVNDELAKKFNSENIVQESGEYEDKVMSQKAVSTKLSDLSLTKAEYGASATIVSLKGNGKNWAISNTKDKFIFRKGRTYKISFQSDSLTFGGEESTQAFLQSSLYKLDGGNPSTNVGSLISLYYLLGSGTFKAKDVTVTPTEDCFLSVEGRWKESETLSVVIKGETLQSINDKIEGVGDRIEKNVLHRTYKQRMIALNLTFMHRSFDYEAPYYPPGNIPILAFMHISDLHGGVKQANDAIEILNTLCNGSENEGGNVRFLIATGDIKYDTAKDDFKYFTDAASLSKVPVFICAGNHDVGNTSLVKDCFTDSELYTNMYKPLITSWDLHSDASQGDSHPTGKNYYFKDFIPYKIRMIVLYEFESDFAAKEEDASKLKYNRGTRAFRQEQIDWLITSLKTTPAGYGVIIAKHQPEGVHDGLDTPFNSIYERKNHLSSYCGSNLIADIVKAFMDKTTINKSYTQTGGVVTELSVNADFSNINKDTEFICYLSGHTHRDYISFLRDFPNQLELTIGANNTGYNFGTDMLQVAGEYSEDVINIYGIDRNRGYVNIVRIGADISHSLQKRDIDSVSYRKEL